MNYFIDWMSVYQDFDFELPFIGDRASVQIDTLTGEALSTNQPTLKYEGSFCTSINIRISGNRLSVSGNPSRINRIDNLFGLTSLDQCINVYNFILSSLGLPNFTKCTRVILLQGEDGKKVRSTSNGAIFTELHITTNKSVGQGCEDDYIKGISTLRYRHMIPRLHTNGKTCDYLSPRGKASTLIYPSIYNKGFELELHSLPKVKRKYGTDSKEYKDTLKIINYCKSQGVVRFEQKLKSAFLRRNNFRFYGLIEEKTLIPTQKEFIKLDNKLEVTAMTLENISEKLIRLGYCNGTRSANTTAMYAIQWMNGMKFELKKSQEKKHRCLLRKIGIDIADTYNVSRHSPVFVREAREVIVKDLEMPEWYKKADSHLQLVA